MHVAWDHPITALHHNFSDGFIPSKPAQGINQACMEKGAAVVSWASASCLRAEGVQGVRLENAGPGHCQVSGG